MLPFQTTVDIGDASLPNRSVPTGAFKLLVKETKADVI